MVLDCHIQWEKQVNAAKRTPVFQKRALLKPYTAGKISTENLLDNVLTYISEHFCFYTLCIISAYKYVKKLRKCK